MRIPSVILLRRYHKVKGTPALRRLSIMMAYRFTCAYCGRRFPVEELTIDHVIPKSKGGKTTWQNCVLADQKCNLQKADKSLLSSGMKLLRQPFVPTSQTNG